MYGTTKSLNLVLVFFVVIRYSFSSPPPLFPLHGEGGEMENTGAEECGKCTFFHVVLLVPLLHNAMGHRRLIACLIAVLLQANPLLTLRPGLIIYHTK